MLDEELKMLHKLFLELGLTAILAALYNIPEGQRSLLQPITFSYPFPWSLLEPAAF